MATEDFHSNKVLLISRGGMAPGPLRVNEHGFHFRRQSDGKIIEVRKADVSGVTWTQFAANSCQLGVRRHDGATITFLGLKATDADKIKTVCAEKIGHPLEQHQLQVSGHNWGEIAVHGRSLAFGHDQPMFEVPLPDVSMVTTPNKDEVLLEFHVDDTTYNDKEDTLIEMAFHVPASHERWEEAARVIRDAAAPDDDKAKKTTAAMALAEDLKRFTEAGAAGDNTVVAFHKVAVLAPRGRFSIEMYPGHIALSGASQEYKIGYNSISRLFILPKPGSGATSQTLVAISLDPPIRKGNTYYSYLLCQFPSDDERSIELNISDDLFAQKNAECGNKLQRVHEGALATVFAHILRGLSTARITRAKMETYTNSLGDGCAVRCSYRSDEGFLFPLEKCFFYVHKPPLMINHQDIESIEFERQGGGVTTTNVRTFDLLIRQKGAAASSYQFRNIQRGEWEPLFAFINAHKIRIENLAQARHGPGGVGAAAGFELGEDEDAGLRAARAEADDEEDEDEDFDIGEEALSESSGGSLDEEVGESEGGDDVEMVDEEGIDVTSVMGKKKKKAKDTPGEEAAAAAPKTPKPKKPKVPKAAAAAAAAEGDGEEGAEGGKKQRKPRKKKDPNAPKKALTGFMFFSNANRERVRTSNPGVPFGQIGKLIGEEWKQLSTEDRAPYEAQAAQDKERYAAAMAEYRAAGGGGGAAAEDVEAEGGDENME